MSHLNGMHLLTAIGDVDDGLVAESLDFFHPLAGEASPVIVLPTRAPNRWLRALAGVGLAAALLCGVVTVTPLLGGPDLWQGFTGVIAPLFTPDETDTSVEEECDGESPDEPNDPDGTDKKNPTWNGGYSGGAYGTGKEPEIPEVPTVRDPTPEWPTVNIPNPRPETPTAPRPSGPGRWP